MNFRHEWKFEINTSDKMILRQRLRAVCRPDVHSAGGIYTIRSLYFDDPNDRALMEKVNGVSRREKFRIRYYNGDTSMIRLEKKSKIDGLCAKQSVIITKEECEKLLEGDISWMIETSADQASCDPVHRVSRPLLTELYSKMTATGLRPKTIVDYTREPFVYGPGNVRVTIDDNIRTNFDCREFLNWDCPTIPVPASPIILEVKWDAYLPDIIRDTVQIPNRRSGAFSKYAACRMYD